MIARSSLGRLARTVFIRSRYLVTVRTFVWNWCLSVAIQQASAVSRAGTKTNECIGWRSVAMIDYKVNSNSRLNQLPAYPEFVGVCRPRQGCVKNRTLASSNTAQELNPKLNFEKGLI